MLTKPGSALGLRTAKLKLAAVLTPLGSAEVVDHLVRTMKVSEGDAMPDPHNSEFPRRIH